MVDRGVIVYKTDTNLAWFIEASEGKIYTIGLSNGVGIAFNPDTRAVWGG